MEKEGREKEDWRLGKGSTKQTESVGRRRRGKMKRQGSSSIDPKVQCRKQFLVKESAWCPVGVPLPVY
jgi:hypothetical protein